MTTRMTATNLGLAKIDTGNSGVEFWLCERPEAAEATFRQTDSLDAAAKAGGACVTLRACWGNNLPAGADEAWLADLLTRTRESDRDEVEVVVRMQWGATAEQP